MWNSKPLHPCEGDVYHDTELGTLLFFEGSTWLTIINTEEGYKYINREKQIDELLENDKFDPEYFGFSGTGNSRLYKFEYGSITYDIVQDSTHDNFYKVSEHDTCGRFDEPVVYYRGKIPTNKFALQLFMNMNFGFLPIVHREMKISDLLD